MISTQLLRRGLAALLFVGFALPASAQSFQVQCPESTITHPNADDNNSEPAYTSRQWSERRHQVPADFRWRRFRDDG